MLYYYSNLQQTHMILIFHSNMTGVSLNSIKQAELCVYMGSVKTCINTFCAFLCLEAWSSFPETENVSGGRFIALIFRAWSDYRPQNTVSFYKVKFSRWIEVTKKGSITLLESWIERQEKCSILFCNPPYVFQWALDPAHILFHSKPRQQWKYFKIFFCIMMYWNTSDFSKHIIFWISIQKSFHLK